MSHGAEVFFFFLFLSDFDICHFTPNTIPLKGFLVESVCDESKQEIIGCNRGVLLGSSIFCFNPKSLKSEVLT